MKSTRRRSSLIALAGVALLTTSTGTALAAPESPAAPPGRYSFDLTAVGVPTRTVSGKAQAGVVDVYFPDGRTQRLSQRSLGLGSSSYQRFGASVTVRDVNDDNLSDLVVGAPGVASKGRTGAAYLLLQNGSGFTAANARTLDNTADPGDRFGAAIAVSGRASSGMLDLWVGAPGRNVNGTKDAGAVYRYYLNATTGAPSFNDVISQDTAQLNQSAETGDQFGEVLTGQQSNGVVVGVPHEDVGAGKDAGEVVFVRTDVSTDLLTSAVTFTQNSKGIPGAAANGDRFGASLSVFGFAVGAPGEDLGPIRDAGRVQLFSPGGGASAPLPLTSFTQDSPGILGKAKKGNQYGAAIALGSYRCVGQFQFAIGAPGVDVGKAKDAGAVFIQSNSLLGGSNCASKQVHQGKGGLLGGTAKSGDRLGQVIATLPGDSAEMQRIDNLMIGVPGKDLGKARNTGVAVVWSGPKKGVLKTFGYSGGNAKGQAYGSSLGISDLIFEMLS